MDIKIKMLYGTGEDDVISQYVSFTRVFDEQRRRYGSTRKAVLETIRICKDQNLLKEYLEEHDLCQVFVENLVCSFGPFAEGKFCMDRCSTRKGGKTMAIVREIVRIEYDRITSVSAY